MNWALVLIPIVDIHEYFSGFKPILLCNVVYKVVAKLIVNRLKLIPSNLVFS